MDWLLEIVTMGLRGAVSFGFAIGFIATIHEFGHYIIAVMCGVRVDEFSLGVGPALLTRRVGDTEYNLRAIPILAYVRPAGMDPEEEFEEGEDPGERSFQAKGFFAKQAILLGGSLFNFLGTLLIFTGILFFHGQDASTIRVNAVVDKSPAHAGGVLTGDVFLEFDGNPISNTNDAIDYIGARAGQTLQIRLARPTRKKLTQDFHSDPAQHEIVTLEVVPEDNGAGGKIGVGVDAWLLNERPPTKMPFGAALSMAKDQTLRHIEQVFVGTLGMFKSALQKFTVPKGVGGPLQIAHVITKQSAFGIQRILILTASLSVSIGVFNLLPFPGLDGGRMFFLVLGPMIAALCRLFGRSAEDSQALVQAVEEWAHIIGILMLLGLMVLVTFKDAFQIFSPDPPPPPAATAPATPGAAPAP